MDKRYVAASLLLLLQSTNQAALQHPEGVRNYNETSQANRTITEIKKIVSNHRPLDYPVINNNKKATPEITTLEELKIRCHHLAKILNSTTTTTTSGFYITAPTTTTPKPPPPNNIKYIKLEPVILQRTILSDGRTIYYWHRSLPSAVTTPPPTSTSSTTTSTYNFRNFFPSLYSAGGAEPLSATTTEKAPTSTEKAAEHQELLYRQQLKFVVPVPYSPSEEVGVRKPWEFDQFAYYPKPLQPETITLQMPYVPTFHVIKALTVPNRDNNE